MTNNPSTTTLLEFALDAAWQAGRMTLAHYQTSIQISRKDDNTPVTIADREAELKIRRLITDNWPDHGIIGEEFGREPRKSSYTWIIDPIDGTNSFISGVPLYSTLIALTDGDHALIGVAHFPALGETIYAVRNGGCYWNGRRAHVSNVDKLSDAVLLTSGLNYFGSKTPAWERLVDNTYIQRTWGDAYGYFLVATGRAEVMVDPAMHLWDSAPFQVIIEEAGGTFTDWQGNPTIHAPESMATNGTLFKDVLSLIHSE
ncbi:MAG: inositol monophosphatase family protein [Candidatus Promineifilaceae bacterium]|nr:inositol monophosphatase family protein [Candidatus Promineifilaceae bacterium]